MNGLSEDFHFVNLNTFTDTSSSSVFLGYSMPVASILMKLRVYVFVPFLTSYHR